LITAGEFDMTETVLHLSRLTDAAVGEDGQTVQFGIEGQDGRKVEISCDHRDIASVIHYMIQLGRNSAARRGQVTPHQFGNTDRVETSPLEVSDIGLMKDLETSDGVLVARMSGFDLGFKVTPFQLRALHAEIERILPNSVLHPKDHHHHDDHNDDGGHHHHHDHDHEH
jgi:hypothetical protein